ncbi:MAG TPA: DUF3052 domain-containing protein [Acidimicrobiia bacterium]|jgi:hypothetical protein|nr:DUF3052 domain-containing protein [Acidimicrobiia bacterium]
MTQDKGDKTLPAKLGIEPGMTVTLLNAPNYFDFDLGDLPDDVEVNRDSDATPSDIYLIFADRSDEAQRAFERVVTSLPPDGAIWFAWPKKSSDKQSDLDENALRELFLPSGMVDNKVCSIDETWSGLRFVVRKENRADWPASTA